MTSAGTHSHPQSDCKLNDRRNTDNSLREERQTTDELLEPEHSRERVVTVVQERRDDAEQRLQAVRKTVDASLEKQSAVLPEVSEKLEQVADSLRKAAASLTGVADTLKESSSPVEVVTHMAQVAEQVADTADRITETESSPGSADAEASGKLAEQLAQIAQGMADVTATLADERRDVDLSLDQERRVTDRIIGHELEQVEATLADEVREEREVLHEEREATDETLTEERHHTDEAVEHVLGLLAEEQQEHAVAQRGVSTRNEFLSIVSHDLRGPLMTISGMASLIEQQAPTDDTGRRIRGWADSVRRSAGVMERLIRDLLDFRSFEDGQLRVIAESLDVRPLIQSAIDAFRAVAPAKFIALDADLPDEPVMAKYDHHRMLQVLSNLIHNAIKFTPDGGAIRIRVVRQGTDCLVSVADTGIGIPKGELRSIFERFRQLDRTDRTGLGLGLYISLWIVEAHGGRIWAESEGGAGTTFYFTLPEN